VAIFIVLLSLDGYGLNANARMAAKAMAKMEREREAQICPACNNHSERKIMKRSDHGQNEVAPKKTEEVKEALDDEESGASINEVSSLLSTQKIEQAIKRAVEEQVQGADTEDEV
jgi:hypothetical protein